MRLVPLLIALLLIAPSALASDRILEVAAWYVWLDPSSEGTFIAGSPQEPYDVKFNSDTGYGVSAAVFFGRRLSAEFGVAQVSSAVGLEARGRTANLVPRQTTFMPLTGALRFHFRPTAMIDPYLGVGAMSILVGNVTGGRQQDLFVLDIEKGDVAYLVNGGLSVELTETFGLLLDAKWAPSPMTMRAVLNDPQGTASDIEVSPLMVSIGFSYRWGR